MNVGKRLFSLGGRESVFGWETRELIKSEGEPVTRSRFHFSLGVGEGGREDEGG